jgi:tetratricopeptide (TPR) repeat protein
MTGDFRVAVADFAIIGNPADRNAGTELAEGVYLKLNESLSEINKDFTITIWSPSRVGKIKGNTPEEMAKSAEKIAQKIGADILIYGLIDMSNPVWQVTPEFYIASDNFYEAEEITGQYQLGETFILAGQGSIARRIELSSKFDVRAQVISRITIGLAYYSLRDYQNAFESFRSTENISGWEETQGKEVVYLLTGNAAMKAQDLDASITELNKSLSIAPDYARPLITLGGVYYLQALEPFDKTKIPSDIDPELLEKAIESYKQALLAKKQPALSDISTKVHFGLGQCYLMQSYSGLDTPLGDAVEEFKIVIADYGDGQNPRIRELAAEAHARLGLIYDLSDYIEDAVQEYQLAADLLYDNPERQGQYQARADGLSAKIAPTAP